MERSICSGPASSRECGSSASLEVVALVISVTVPFYICSVGAHDDLSEVAGSQEEVTGDFSR